MRLFDKVVFLGIPDSIITYAIADENLGSPMDGLPMGETLCFDVKYPPSTLKKI